jgi:hypothetical protein
MKIIYVVCFALIITIFQLFLWYINKLIESYNPKLALFFPLSLIWTFGLITSMNKPTRSGIIIADGLNLPPRWFYKHIKPV